MFDLEFGLPVQVRDKFMEELTALSHTNKIRLRKPVSHQPKQELGASKVQLPHSRVGLALGNDCSSDSPFVSSNHRTAWIF